MGLEWTQLDSYELSYGIENAHCPGIANAPLDFTFMSNFDSKTWELTSDLFMIVVGPALSFSTNKKSQLMRSRTQVIVKIQNSVRMSIMLEKLNQGPTKTQTTNIIQINSIKHKRELMH